MIPLWKLANTALSQHLNTQEYLFYLRTNVRQTDNCMAVVPSRWLLRLAMLMLPYQLGCLGQSILGSLYVCLKLLYLLRVGNEGVRIFEWMVVILGWSCLSYIMSGLVMS